MNKMELIKQITSQSMRIEKKIAKKQEELDKLQCQYEGLQDDIIKVIHGEYVPTETEVEETEEI